MQSTLLCFKIQTIKNGFAGPKSFRGFRETRLRVISNFGDSGEIHGRARAKMGSTEQGEASRGKAQFRARVSISPES